MPVNDYFKNIYCINLDRRLDRWEEAQKEFEKFNITGVERISACDGQTLNINIRREHKGELGSCYSHLWAIKRAKEVGAERCLIFEDDIKIKEDTFEFFNPIMEQLPDNWDMLYFGGNHQCTLGAIAKNVNRTVRTFALQMYAVNAKAYDILINHLENEIQRSLGFDMNSSFISLCADYHWANIHPLINVYVGVPNLSYQREDFSDIQHTVVNYDFLK